MSRNYLICIVLVSFFWKTNGQTWKPVNPTRSVVKDTSLTTRGGERLYHLSDFSARIKPGAQFRIPTPEGKITEFRLDSSPVFDATLQERHPEIQAYSFRNNEISGRLAVSPSGLDIVFADKKARYAIEQIDANTYRLDRVERRQSNYNLPQIELGKCLVSGEAFPTETKKGDLEVRRAEMVKRRSYRLAISVTSTYARRHGATEATVLAEINKVFNRVNEVFLRELSLRFEIIGESTKLFYYTEETDPYTEGSNILLLNKIDELLVKEIGRKNYDLGHLLATNCGQGTAGTSAGTGTICEFNKGKALSCDLTNNLSEYVRVLTHELGHQLGAAHTWSNCPGVNSTQRNNYSAYEPGSGSSIMSYLNSCGPQNISFIPGPWYFHTGSIQQMNQYIETGNGSKCVAVEEITNHHPVITYTNIPKNGDLYIPVQTPFILRALAEDADQDQLTYAWDQLDIGPIAPLGEPIQSGPSIRSYAPDTSGTRYIPRLSSLYAKEKNPEEVLPAYSRDFTFGLTVRDNHPQGGGTVQKTVSFKSTSTAGPFFIDYPNAATNQLFAGSLTKFKWNVAGTDRGLVNTSHVTIRMSTDGGKSFPIVLEEKTDNDGEQDVQLPGIVSDQVRFLIQGYDHVFFDVSDENLAIVNPTTPTFGLDISPATQLVCLPAEATISIGAFPVLDFDETISYSIENPYPDVSIDWTDTTANVNGLIKLVFTIPPTFASDTLRFQLRARGSTTDTFQREIAIIAVNNSHEELTLTSPENNASGVEVVPSFVWTPSENADYYTLQISESAGFAEESIVISEPNISADSFPASTILKEGEVYFWRVIPFNQCAGLDHIPVSAFQTRVQDCRTFEPSDLPKGLGGSSTGEIESKIQVDQDFTVSDVNVLKIEGFHESVNQLKFLLEKDSTRVTLYEGECGIRSLQFNLNYDDESVDFTDCRLGSGTRVKPLEPLALFNDQQSKGTWIFRWQDNEIGAGGLFENWMLELCGSITREPLAVNTDTLFVAPNQSAELSQDVILVQDLNSVVFEWVDTVLHGQLLMDGQPLRPGHKWTGNDVLQGRIRYKNNTDFQSENIVLSLESIDGKWSGIITLPVKLDASVPVSTDNLEQKISVYPNPARTSFTISSEIDQSITSVTISDLNGKVYSHKSLTTPATHIAVSATDWPAGIYVVTLETLKGRAIQKIVVQ